MHTKNFPLSKLYYGLTLVGAFSALGTNANANPIKLASISTEIRKTTDGSGISNIVAYGGKIVTVDPNAAKIKIYSIGSDGVAPNLIKTCDIPHQFLPWQTDIQNNKLYIYNEPRSDIGTKRNGTLSNSSDAFIKYAIPDLSNDNCPNVQLAKANKPIIGNQAFEFSGNKIKIAQFNIAPSNDASLLSIKKIGTLNGNKSVFVIQEAVKADYKYYGRIHSRIRIAIFDAKGKTISSGEVKDFDITPQSANVRGLYKRGFEYLAASDNYLFFVQTDKNHQFVLTKYQLLKDKNIPKQFVIGPDELLDQPLEDDDANTATQSTPNDEKPNATDIAKWRNLIETRAQHYTNYEWEYRNQIPCLNDEPRCVVVSDNDGNLHDAKDTNIAPTFPLKNHGSNSNEWALPRNLVGLKIGDKVKSLPYSYAGGDNVERFDMRLNGEKVTPIGNIVEKLQRTDFNPDDPQTHIHYPLGIDCSAFVARMFGNYTRSTGAMSRFEDGAIYPNGPVNSYAKPVSDINNLKTGDIIFRSGHVMIFMNSVKIRSQSGNQKAIGLVFYEATSRCGMVCKSIYEPDFINGWWIYRPISLKDEAGNIFRNPHPN